MKYHFQINGEMKEIEATKMGNHLTLTLEDGSQLEAEVNFLPDGQLQVIYPGGRLRLVGHKGGDKRELWMKGKVYRYQRVDPDSSGDESDSAGSLSASIPSVVSDILIRVGDSVSSGDKLILLESMKMIIPIQAPKEGEIAEILCQIGDAVQPGIPLIKFK